MSRPALVAMGYAGRYEGGMTTRPARDTYRHGNLRAEALKVAYRLVADGGYVALSLRQVADEAGVAHRSLYNHFKDREALLDAVATEAYLKLAAIVARAQTPEDYVTRYIRFALANRAIYTLITSRPHGTMKYAPPLQAAAHRVITEAMRVFCPDIASSGERRRTVMKVYIILYGAISLYAAGILDQPNEKALIAEISAMVRKI